MKPNQTKNLCVLGELGGKKILSSEFCLLISTLYIHNIPGVLLRASGILYNCTTCQNRLNSYQLFPFFLNFSQSFRFFLDFHRKTPAFFVTFARFFPAVRAKTKSSFTTLRHF